MATRKKIAIIQEQSSCQVCAYYKQDPDIPRDKETWGYCLRFPPVVVASDDDDVRTTFPQVRPVWVCGEFRRKLDS